MTQTTHQDTPHTNDQTRKQRKKQARREAKLLLKLEGAHRDVQKAEKKLAKAQANLEASRKYVRELEEQLKEQQAPQQTEVTPPVATTEPGAQAQETPAISVPDQGESYEDRSEIEELHLSSPPPVEGRADINVNASTPEATPPADQESGTPPTGRDETVETTDL